MLSKTATAVAGLKATLKLLKELLDDCPVPGLKAAISGVVAVMDIVQNIKANANDIAEVSERLRQIQQKIIEPIDFAARESPEIITEAMKKRTDELGRAIDEMLVTAVKMHKRNPLLRIANHEADKDMIAGLKGGLDQLIVLFNTESTLANEVRGEQMLQILLGLDAGSMQTMSESMKNLEDIAKTQEAQFADKDTRDLVNSLPRADARYDSGTRTGATTCMKGTRTELLGTIRSWVDQEESQCPPIFWLFGEAGIGKSTVAHTIASELDGLERLAGSFFFSRDDVARQNHLLVIPTIAHRLAHLDPRIAHSIAVALKADADVAKAVPSKQLAELIVKPIGFLNSSLGRPIVVVIDALDECSSEEGAKEFIMACQKALRDLPSLRLLITSRPNWSLQQRIAKNPSISKSFQMHDIDHFVATEDIKGYMRHNLRLIAYDFDLTPPWPSESHTITLTKKCGVLFIVASTSIKFLRNDEVYDPQAQLDGLLSGTDDSGVRSSPNADMDFLYRRILELMAQKANTQETNDPFFVLFRSIIGSMISLRRPLDVGAIRELMGVAESDVHLVLRRLSSVIRLPDSPNDPIQFFHPSFPEFICNSKRCADSRFVIKSEDANARLFCRCMHLLHQVSKLPQPFTIEEQNLLSAFRYARRYVFDHLNQASDEDKGVRTELESFYSSGLLRQWQFFALSSRRTESNSVIALLFQRTGGPLKSIRETLEISATLALIATDYLAAYLNTNLVTDLRSRTQMQKCVLEQFMGACSDNDNEIHFQEPGLSAIILALHLHQSIVCPFTEMDRSALSELEICEERTLAIERVARDAAAVLEACRSTGDYIVVFKGDQSDYHPGFSDTLRSYLEALLHCLQAFCAFDDPLSLIPHCASVREISFVRLVRRLQSASEVEAVLLDHLRRERRLASSGGQ